MTVKTLYRYNNTVSLTQPEGDYTTLLRIVADDGYILKLSDGTLTNCIDCKSSEGITEVDDSMSRQMEMIGYDKKLKSTEEELADIKATFEAYKTQVEAEKEENDAALMEVASLVSELSTRADEHEEAIMELGDVVSE